MIGRRTNFVTDFPDFAPYLLSSSFSPIVDFRFKFLTALRACACVKTVAATRHRQRRDKKKHGCLDSSLLSLEEESASDCAW